MKLEQKYRIEECAGDKVFNFTVIGDAYASNEHGQALWVFKCACGKYVELPPSRVYGGHCKSCGCLRHPLGERPYEARHPHRVNPDEYIGQKSGLLTVVGHSDLSESGTLRLECDCDCGGHISIMPYQFRKGLVKSCGCLRRDIYTNHLLDDKKVSSHPLYRVWKSMVSRCYNPKNKSYHFYGERGIQVCDEWRDNPKAFIEWAENMGQYSHGLTIARFDNDGPYSPQNCRFIDIKRQQRNKRSNKRITYNGETKCVADWAETLGVRYSSLYYWTVKKGRTIEEYLIEKEKRHI